MTTIAYDQVQALHELRDVTLEGARRALRPTHAEAHAILAALSSTWLEPGLLGQHLRADLQDLDPAELPEGVDQRALARRVRDLTLAQTAAIEIWAADYWALPEVARADHLARLTKS